MKNTILIITALSFSIICCTNKHAGIPGEKEYAIYVSPFKPVLFSDDHTSEGFLAPLDDGRILLIFRFDFGIEGNHVGADGYIAQIYYDPLKDQWSKVEPVYNSHQYDDRNIHGGITREGRIVTFFRKYTPDGRVTEGRYFIYSDDNGRTWSDPQRSEAWSDPLHPDSRFGVWGTGRMFYNDDIDRYLMLGYGRHINYITYSKDGSS